MSDLRDKVLRSGLIDKHTAALLERYELIQEGESDKVPDGDPLHDATKAELELLVRDLDSEIDKEARMRETMLDLDKLRWHTKVVVWSNTTRVTGEHPIDAVIDRQGRYYFRIQDVDPTWFVPGRRIIREGFKAHELILEASPLYLGDQVVCIQVTTQAA
jgi:hypothetical protein